MSKTQKNHITKTIFSTIVYLESQNFNNFSFLILLTIQKTTIIITLKIIDAIIIFYLFLNLTLAVALDPTTLKHNRKINLIENNINI